MWIKMFASAVLFFHVVAFMLVAAATDVAPELSKLTVYNNSNGEFYACFQLQLHKNICAKSSPTSVQIKQNGQVLFDVRETPTYEFRRIGNMSLLKFKNETKEKRLLVNNLVFDSPEQVHPTYLDEIDEKEFEKQGKELMTNGDVDSMYPLADAIDELNLTKEQQKAVRPILALAMHALRTESLLKANGELKMNDSEYRSQRKSKRSLCPWYKRQPVGPKCLGMCGPSCSSCWSIVCGDCCYHQGCYDHDICCQSGYLTLGCWSPLRLIFRFSCSGYPHCGRPSCFPAQATVQRKNSKTTLLKDLRVGDEVLTVSDDGKEVYTKVLTFLDFNPHSMRTYLQVKFTDGQSLTVSKRHLVFKRDSESAKVAVFAEEIAVGEYLFKHSKLHKSLQAAQVVAVEETQVHGAYAPLTEHGTLLVDGVFTSCYAQIRSHRLAHFALTPLRLWKSWFPSKEVQNGIHSYAEHLQSGVEWFKPLLPKPVSDVLGG